MKKSTVRKIMWVGLGAINLITCPALADPAANWAGPYIGAHLGEAMSGFNNSPGVAGPDGSSSNYIAGGQIGDNWQYNQIVFGVEADGSKIDLTSHNPSSTFEEDWMATFRGRAGYSIDLFLPYVTAGLALTDAVSKVPGAGQDSNVEPGITAGAGVDMLLDNKWMGSGQWFGRVEYLYVDVPKDNANAGGTTVRGGSDNNILRVALNYKFE
jgi:outer membrane immunogenic protein